MQERHVSIKSLKKNDKKVFVHILVKGSVLNIVNGYGYGYGFQTSQYWTDWLNRDMPGGMGDYETYKDFVPFPCKSGYKPISIIYDVVDGSSQKSKIHVSAPDGLSCLNKENPKGCQNFKVRFLCGK